NLAASQARQKTVRLHQADACLRQTNPVANPKRKLSTCKIRIVEDRIEARGPVVRRVRVALRPQERALEAQVIAVNRRLDSGHVRTHLHTSSGNRISLVVTKRIVVRMREIETAEMTIAANAQISDLDRVWPDVADYR